MNPQLKNSNSNLPLTPEDEQKMISEVRETIKKQKSIEKMKEFRPDEFSRCCCDGSILRYLRAQNWNVKKAVKMLEMSLIWRMNYKPEEICWEHVAAEAETGKIYRSSYMDKNGRTVLVMRPRFQETVRISKADEVVGSEVTMISFGQSFEGDPKDEEFELVCVDFYEADDLLMTRGMIKLVKKISDGFTAYFPDKTWKYVLLTA